MAYQKDNTTDWGSKEKRELFCKIVNCYIMKSGADKEPLVEKILPIAKDIVDKAWENYPDKTEEGEEKPV